MPVKGIHVSNVESSGVGEETLHDAARNLRAEWIVQEDDQRPRREIELAHVAMHDGDACSPHLFCVP